jgi:hypothetical protein
MKKTKLQKRWETAYQYFKLDNKSRGRWTENFNKKWREIGKKADKMVESDDYKTHLKGQILLRHCWKASVEYDRMIRKVILLEMIDDFSTYCEDRLAEDKAKTKVKTT